LVDAQRVGASSSRFSKNAARRIIAGELRSKGITDEIIEWVTSDITDDSEFANAMQFAERKARSVRSLAPEVAYRRMHGALSRRGFSGHIVTRVLTELGITRS